MKTFFFAISLAFIFVLLENNSYAQTYTTESKSCGSCNGAVSINSKIGMICPHCGVRWGYENTTRTNSYNNSYNYSSPSSLGYGYTTSNLNFRSSKSTYSTVYTTIPKGTKINIISSSGNWYYIEYTYFDDYRYVTRKGYVSASYVR